MENKSHTHTKTKKSLKMTKKQNIKGGGGENKKVGNNLYAEESHAC